VKIFILVLIFLPGFAFGNNVFNGKEVYLKECSSCHGYDGRGDMAGVSSFVESNILFKTDRELTNVINDGKGLMPAYRGLLSREEIEDVVVYLRTFL